jgi:hypothetical protein
LREEFPGIWVPLWRPLRGESHFRRRAIFFALCDDDDAFLCETVVRVFEGFFVDGFEVGEVALVVESFAELWMLARAEI